MVLASQWEEGDGLCGFIVTRGRRKRSARTVGTNGASVADPLDVGDNTWLRLSADQEMETREESRFVHSTESHSHERRTPAVTAAARVTWLNEQMNKWMDEWMGGLAGAFILYEGGVSPWKLSLPPSQRGCQEALGLQGRDSLWFPFSPLWLLTNRSRPPWNTLLCSPEQNTPRFSACGWKL